MIQDKTFLFTMDRKIKSKDTQTGARNTQERLQISLIVFTVFFSFAKSAAACGETCSHLMFLVTAGYKIIAH